MDKIIVLIASILMPRDVPDVDHVQKMASFEECWAAAQDFMSHELTESMREKGAIGLPDYEMKEIVAR
jgi:hypothetical protein